jgi:hypothetical protein
VAKRAVAKKEPINLRASFVAIARKLGFMNEEQAAQATEILRAHNEADIATEDLLVDAGLITHEQAVKVEAERISLDPYGHIDDQFKRAGAAVSGALSSAAQLVSATEKK